MIQTKEFTLINLTQSINDIRIRNTDREFTGFNSNYLILDFGEKEKGDFCTAQFKLETKLKIKTTTASCGCTRPSFQKIEDGYIITIEYNPSLISKNISKFVGITLVDDRKITINLIINN